MGGSSHAENQAIVDEQLKQAEDAKLKDKLHTQHIQTGLQKIKWAFEGKPVTAPVVHAFDWKTFRPEATKDKTGNTIPRGTLPKGFKYVRVDAKGKIVPGTPAQAAVAPGVIADPYGGPPAPGYGSAGPGTVSLTPGKAAVAAGPATTGEWAIQGPKGYIYRKGHALNYTANDPTGERTGGTDPLADKYRDDYYNYYSADVNTQHDKARQEAAFRFARAGLGVSSAANDVNVDLEKQNTANISGVANQADQQKKAFNDRIAGLRKSATDQLYQTEDPTVAATTALNDVRNLSLETPSQSPLADVFNIAAIGGANLLKNFNNQKAYNQFEAGLPQGAGSSHINN